MTNRNVVYYEEIAPAYRAQQAERRRQLRKRRRRQRLVKRLVLCIAGILVALAVALLVLPVLSGAEDAGPGGALPAEDAPQGADTTGGEALAAALPRSEGGIVVAIDPGHGGYNANIGTIDLGCSGNGYTEPDLTYPTADALAARLTADGRFTPVLTTDGSAYLKGSERAAVANEAGAELLLAIHFNSDPYCDSNGFECFPSTPAQPYNADALRFARLIAAGFAENGATLRGEDGVRYLYFHGDNDERQIFESSDTSVHSDPTYGVIQYAECPAVLVEEFFLTSSSDVARFGGDEGCQMAAGIYYKAICEYFGLEPK